MTFNFTDIWNILNVNAPSYGLILNGLALIISICVTFYTIRYLPRWQFMAQYKIELIKDVFPKLLSDINKSIDGYHAFLEGWNTSLSPFNELEDIIKNGKIEYIKNIDKELYEQLRKTNNEITPLAINISIERRDLYKNITVEWSNYINGLDNINFDVNYFVSELWNNASSDIWLENYDYNGFISLSHRVFQYLEKNSVDLKRMSDEQLKELIEIAKKNVTEVKSKIPELEKLLKEIVEDNVIKKLEKYIAYPI